MQLSVTARHMETTESMKRYVEEKLGKLNRYFDRVESIDVVLDQVASKHQIEVLVRTDHKDTFIAQLEADDFYEAVDLAVDKLERQLTRHKEKLRNRKHPTRTSQKMEENPE